MVLVVLNGLDACSPRGLYASSPAVRPRLRQVLRVQGGCQSPGGRRRPATPGGHAVIGALVAGAS